MNSKEITVVIDKLEELARNNTFSLISNDTTRFEVPLAPLLSCSYFENHFNQYQGLTQMTIEASSLSLRIFKAYLENETIDDVGDIFEPMAFACSIKCVKFARYCAHAAKGVSIPAGSQPGVSVAVLQQLVKFLPVRTSEQYEEVLKTLTHSGDSGDSQLVQAIADVLAYEPVYDNVPLPLPLFQKRITVAFMKDIQGHPMTAILVDRKWVSSNIFGPDFCPVNARVKNFHLCFNKYVLYQTLDGSVMLKNLVTNAPDERLYHTSKFFRSRCNQLHLIRQDEETGRDILYEWDQDKLDFVQKFSSGKFKLRTAHRNANGRLIVVLSTGSVLKFSDDSCIYPEYEPYEAGVADAIDGWTMDGSGAFSKTISVDEQSENATLEIPAQIGFSIVGTRKLGEGMYESVIYEKSESSNFSFHSSPIHGKVFCLSDVVVL